MSSTNDEYRFLEDQLRSTQSLMQQMTLIQSTLTRRMRRLDRLRNSGGAVAQEIPNAPARRARPAPARAPRQEIQGVQMNLGNQFDAESNPRQPARQRRVIKIVYRAVTKSNFEKKMDDVCAVCQEDFKQKDCLTTNCKHDLCSTCMHRWTETKSQEGAIVTCPMCRVNITSLLGYRERARRRTGAEMASAASASRNRIV